MENDSIPKEDTTTKSRTIFDATPFEIFWRNFLAGIARTLGSIFLYILFIFLLSYLSYIFVFPKLSPFFESFEKIGDSLGSFQNLKLPSNFTLPSQ